MAAFDTVGYQDIDNDGRRDGNEPRRARTQVLIIHHDQIGVQRPDPLRASHRTLKTSFLSCDSLSRVRTLGSVARSTKQALTASHYAIVPQENKEFFTKRHSTPKVRHYRDSRKTFIIAELMSPKTPTLFYFCFGFSFVARPRLIPCRLMLHDQPI